MITGGLSVTSVMITSGLTVANSQIYSNGAPFVLYQPSDRNLKVQVAPVINALQKISNLRGVYFKWKNDAKATGIISDDSRHIGLIAQNVQSVVPEAVNAIGDGNYLGVDYSSLVSLLIAGFQELQKQQLKAKLVDNFSMQLRTRIESLQNLIAQFDELKHAHSLLRNKTAILQSQHDDLLQENQMLLTSLSELENSEHAALE